MRHSLRLALPGPDVAAAGDRDDGLAGADSTAAQAGWRWRAAVRRAVEGPDGAAGEATAGTLGGVEHAVGGAVEHHPAAVDQAGPDPDAGCASRVYRWWLRSARSTRSGELSLCSSA